MKSLLTVHAFLCLVSGMILSVLAQDLTPPPLSAYQPLSPQQLDQLLGPMALYPDPLIAQILPAATLPTQIVLADRYVNGGGDPNLIEQQPWDASVQAVARYKDVLKWMDDNLTWTTQVGQAFLNQQPDVMQAIQRLRASASKLGNLRSSPQQQVSSDGGDIEILPVDPQVIYVPVYQPAQVYYDLPGGSPFISFGIGWPMGAWLNFDFDWHNRHLVYWGRDHPRPSNWWHQSVRQRDMGHTSVWRPDRHPGALAVKRGDRGYPGTPTIRSSLPGGTRPELAHPAPPRAERSPSMSRVVPAAVPHAVAPISHPASPGAFSGVHSPSATKSYSNRGQQSLKTVPRSAPVTHLAPSGASGTHAGPGAVSGGHAGGGKR